MSKREARQRKRLREKQKKVESEQIFVRRKEEDRLNREYAIRERIKRRDEESLAILSMLLSRRQEHEPTFTTSSKDVISYPDENKGEIQQGVLRIKTLIHEVCPGAAITTKEKSNEYRKFTEFTIQVNADISLDDLSNKFMELHRRVNSEIKDVSFEYAFDFKTESPE